ncbi:MAG: hypothetical protein Q9M35_05195 [Rhodothermus sp.]|nr:hypothetical protein [Rhodothermus sp.]
MRRTCIGWQAVVLSAGLLIGAHPLAAQPGISLLTGPVRGTIGAELSLHLSPYTALTLSATTACWKSGQDRPNFLLGGLQLFFKPEGNRWLLAAYAGTMQRGDVYLPVGGLTGGFEWQATPHWSFSAEIGIGVTIGVLLIAAIPLPFSLVAARIRYRL